LGKGWGPLVFLNVAGLLISVVCIGRVVDVAFFRPPSGVCETAKDPPKPTLAAGSWKSFKFVVLPKRWIVERTLRDQGRQKEIKTLSSMACTGGLSLRSEASAGVDTIVAEITARKSGDGRSHTL
jgi:hypothetical protein